MKLRISNVVCVSLLTVALGGWFGVRAQSSSPAMPPKSIPTFSTAGIARTAFFYVGGKYVGPPGQQVMDGAMYVEVWVPTHIRHPYPIVFLHGAGQTGTDWRQTPDGREGWAYNFVHQGYVVYMEDYPARGRSAYVPDYDGRLTIRTAPQLEKIWTDLTQKGDWPQAKYYTEWPSNAPNRGTMGDPVFDAFARTQVQFLADGKQAQMVRDANVALLDELHTPVILITHSQGGNFGWAVADSRPQYVKAIITAEPGGPQIEAVNTATQKYTSRKINQWGPETLPLHYDPPITDPSQLQVYLTNKPAGGPGTVPCYLQKAPVHKLVNLEHIPVLDVSSQASYHRVFDACVPMWLKQAGVHVDFVKLEDVGLTGNAHEMMLEKNSAGIAKFFMSWLAKNVH